MKTIRLALMSLAAVFGVLSVSAQQAQAISVTGAATVLKPGAAEAVPLVAGEVLPEGSTVQTGKGATVLIQSHDGIQTGVSADSTVAVGPHGVSADGVRTAVIDLKSGTTVAVLDPAKRAVNNYAIRTPKGVAAARGTVYTATVKLSNGGEAIVTVNTVTGAVSFAIANGPTVTVAAGNQSSSTNPSAVSLSSVLTNNGAIDPLVQEALAATVKVVSMISQVSTNPNVQGENRGQAQNTLTDVVREITKVANEVAETNPTAAQTLVTETVTTVRQFAGDSATPVVKQISAASSDALKPTVTEAQEATVTTVTVEVKTTTTTNQQPQTQITTPVAPESPTGTQPDITIIVSPAG